MNSSRTNFIRTQNGYKGSDAFVHANQSKEASLTTLKKSCKQIESEAKVLANRIALLKQEELKAWKKIEETKQKAQEVYFLKRKNEEKNIQKQSKSQNDEKKLKSHTIKSIEIRKQKKIDHLNIIESIYQQKHKDMLEVRRQKEVNEARKRQLQSKILQNNLNSRKNVKIKEAEGALKKKEYLDSKIKSVKLEKEKASVAAEMKRNHKIFEVLAMEKIEMELIRKIQSTQLLQKEASEELSTALSHPTQVYTQKYFLRSTSSNPTTPESSHKPLSTQPKERERSLDSDSNVDQSVDKSGVLYSDQKFERNIQSSHIKEFSRETELSVNI